MSYSRIGMTMAGAAMVFAVWLQFGLFVWANRGAEQSGTQQAMHAEQKPPQPSPQGPSPR